MALFLNGKEVLSSIVMHGTWTASGTVTLPAVILGGTLTIGGQVFDAGSWDAQINTTGNQKGLVIQNTSDGANGVGLKTNHISASPAVNDELFVIFAYGKNSVGGDELYSRIVTRITSPTDGAEESDWQVWTMVAGAANTAMTLSGAGGLSVDADIGTGDDPVALFDSIPAKYGVDDAQFLVQNVVNKETLPKFCEIGVMTRKDTGSGYMLNTQKAQYFTWGAIKALYERISDLEEKLAT